LENKEKIQSNPYQWDKFGVYEKLIKTNKTHLFSYFIRRKIILFLIWVGSLLYLLTWLSYLITSYSDKSLERLITDGIIWALPAAGMIGLGAIYKPESHRMQNFILIMAGLWGLFYYFPVESNSLDNNFNSVIFLIILENITYSFFCVGLVFIGFSEVRRPNTFWGTIDCTHASADKFFNYFLVQTGFKELGGIGGEYNGGNHDAFLRNTPQENLERAALYGFPDAIFVLGVLIYIGASFNGAKYKKNQSAGLKLMRFAHSERARQPYVFCRGETAVILNIPRTFGIDIVETVKSDTNPTFSIAESPGSIEESPSFLFSDLFLAFSEKCCLRINMLHLHGDLNEKQKEDLLKIVRNVKPPHLATIFFVLHQDEKILSLKLNVDKNISWDSNTATLKLESKSHQ